MFYTKISKQAWAELGQAQLILELELSFATLGLHLEFSAKLKIWQVPACKMEPGSGYDLLLLGGSVGWPTSEKNPNSVAFNPILLNN